MDDPETPKEMADRVFAAGRRIYDLDRALEALCALALDADGWDHDSGGHYGVPYLPKSISKCVKELHRIGVLK